MKVHLHTHSVITKQEREEMDKMNNEQDQMLKILDILEDSLTGKETIKFKGFLRAMEQCEDKSLQEAAIRLGE